jgi:hypothetical protein
MLYTPSDQYSCSAALRRSVCSVADIVCEPKGLPWIEMCLIQEADVDAVLCEKMIQLDLPTTNAVGVPESKPQGFYRAPPRPYCNIQPRIGSQFSGLPANGQVLREGTGRL